MQNIFVFRQEDDVAGVALPGLVGGGAVDVVRMKALH